MITRNPVPFLKRLGLVDEPARPKPRFDPSSFLVHRVPLHPPKPLEKTLVSLEGAPPPDRGGTYPWPGQT